MNNLDHDLDMPISARRGTKSADDTAPEKPVSARRGTRSADDAVPEKPASARRGTRAADNADTNRRGTMSADDTEAAQKWQDYEGELLKPSGGDKGFTLLKKIDGAGQAAIFTATHPDHEGKTFAVKIYAENGISEDKYADWDTVMQRVGKINSPYVVKVYAHGRTKQNDPYVVMDYYANGAVSEHLGPAFLPDEMILNTFVHQLNEGLHAIHEAGIYHCDIKPDNIVFADETRSRLVILDFGIAIPMEKKEDGSYPEIVTKKQPETIEYSAPEIEQGRLSTVTDRSDYFSLGVSLLVMASHRNIFDDHKYVHENASLYDHRLEVRRLLVTRRFPFDKTVDPYLLRLIEKLTDVDPNDRADYEDVKRWVARHGVFGKYSFDKKHRCPIDIGTVTVDLNAKESFELKGTEAYVDFLGKHFARGLKLYSGGSIIETVRKVDGDKANELLRIFAEYEKTPVHGFSLTLLSLDQDAPLYCDGIKFESFGEYVERIDEHLMADASLSSIPYSYGVIKKFAQNQGIKQKGLDFIDALEKAPRDNRKELLRNFFSHGSERFFLQMGKTGENEKCFYLDGKYYTEFKQLTPLLFNEKGEANKCPAIFNPAFLFYITDVYGGEEEKIEELKAIFAETDDLFARNARFSALLSGEIDCEYCGIPLHTFSGRFLPRLRSAYEKEEEKENVAKVLRSGILTRIIEACPGYLKSDSSKSEDPVAVLEDLAARKKESTDVVIYTAYHSFCESSCLWLKCSADKEPKAELVHDLSELAAFIGRTQARALALPEELRTNEEFRLWCQNNGHGQILEKIKVAYITNSVFHTKRWGDGK